jgi:hypothetical protein
MKTKIKITFYILFIYLSYLLCHNVFAETTNTFIIDKSAIKIIKELKENADDVNFTIPDEAIKVLDIADVSIQLYARPKLHYYRFNIDLVKPVNKVFGVTKQLEIWAKPNQTILKSSIDITYGRNFRFPLRWINCIKEKIILDIESKILRFEEQKIRKISEN